MPVVALNRIYHSRRRGGVLVYVTLSLTALIGIVSLAVDWGRVEMAKTELDRGVTAAARYAVTGISDGTALTKTNSLGSYNTVDNNPLVFQSSDVEVGKWDSVARTFTPGNTAPNAIRVTGRRTAATGNPVSLVIGQIVGSPTCDLVVRAIAKVNLGGYGIVGLNSISMTGNSSDSYWAGSGGSYSGHGAIASNGNITLSGNSSINGDAHPGVGGTVSGASAVTGSTTPLTAPLSYPNGSTVDSQGVDHATTNNDSDPGLQTYTSANSFGVNSNKQTTLQGGYYYFRNVNISGNVTFQSATTIYCYGSFSLGGQAITSGSLPTNLTIIMCPDAQGNAPGSVSIGSGSTLYANIYAPQSNVTFSGSGDLYGRVVGLSVSMTGTSNIHYDLSLNGNNGAISLVQ